MHTRNTIIMPQIALLAALASALQLAESCIPMPFPGMKIGFANLITLIAIVMAGPGSGLAVALLRTVVSSLLIGTFLSTSFILSFSGAMASALAMGLMYVLNRRLKLFSVIGISIVGAVANNMAQIAVVSALFTHGILAHWLIPYLLLSAVVTGYGNGFLAARVCRRLVRGRKAVITVSPGIAQTPSDSSAYPSLSSLWFFGSVATFLVTIFVNDIHVLASIAAGLAFILFCLGIRSYELVARFSRIMPLIAFILIINIIGKPETRGFAVAIEACARLIILVMLGVVLHRSVSRERLTELLSRCVRPLQYIGVPADEWVAHVALSLDAVPRYSQIVSQRFRRFASPARRSRRKSLKYIAAYATMTVAILLRGDYDVSPLS